MTCSLVCELSNPRRDQVSAGLEQLRLLCILFHIARMLEKNTPSWQALDLSLRAQGFPQLKRLWKPLGTWRHNREQRRTVGSSRVVLLLAIGEDRADAFP